MKLPKPAPSVPAILAEEGKDLSFLFQRSKPAIRDLLDRANEEPWNYEQCGYHVSGTGLSRDQFWVLVKLARESDRQAIPLRDRRGKPFTFRLPRSAQRILHLIDLHLGGTIGTTFPQLDRPEERQRYLVTSLTEEAIASSQIEGAAVTRDIAREMLRTERPPQNTGEQMILNNYRTIRFLNERRTEPLTVARLHEIQSQLTHLTLDKPDASGRFRRPDESITVWDDEDQKPLHVPPLAEELPERIEKLCAFGNAPTTPEGSEAFVHPAVRAIVLHFWLGYDHPYVDGNGRTARALFYWSMLRSGYWLVEYLTVSSIIRNQPKQYARAFLDTETDDNDLTYFVLYHLRVIERSIEEFRAYLARKQSEREQLADILGPALFNPRQQAILIRALKEPTTRFTYESHAHSHGVTLATARSDLLDLEGKGLLHGNRAGRRFEFIAVPDLGRRLRRMGRGRE